MGEWWITHREDDGAPSLEDLVERTTAWLWTGPVSALARTRADAAVPSGPRDAVPHHPDDPTTAPPQAPHTPEEPS